jgi:hypothetical protein
MTMGKIEIEKATHIGRNMQGPIKGSLYSLLIQMFSCFFYMVHL